MFVLCLNNNTLINLILTISYMVDSVIVHGGIDALEGLTVSKWKNQDLIPDSLGPDR